MEIISCTKQLLRWEVGAGKILIELPDSDRSFPNPRFYEVKAYYINSVSLAEKGCTISRKV